SNINGYYTKWKNRPVNNKVTKEFPDGPRTVNINGMDALHMGVEVDFAYKITPKLTAEGVVSIGDWTWNSAKDSITFRDDNGNLATVDGTPNGEIVYESFDAVGVHVGDAAQTQYSGSIKYEFKKGMYLKTRVTHFRRHYSNFDPVSLKGDDARRESWRIPNYYLVDIHAGYRFKVKSIPFNLRMSVLNVTDVIYISDAQNNETRALYISSSDFDTKSAGVFFGLGRRYNLSLKITI
ncbi:MAG: TonB-dependent receptor, partial [Bacteroidetes bacterium]|nr:TonB-dependent receptor [Bacteroidota bacterium]